MPTREQAIQGRADVRGESVHDHVIDGELGEKSCFFLSEDYFFHSERSMTLLAAATC
jgi:hypothetical protein